MNEIDNAIGECLTSFDKLTPYQIKKLEVKSLIEKGLIIDEFYKNIDDEKRLEELNFSCRENLYDSTKLDMISEVLFFMRNDPSLAFKTQPLNETLILYAFSKGRFISLKYLTLQTPKICCQILKRDGMEIQYVLEKTEEVCLEAVKQNGLALQFIPREEQTLNQCFEAVRQNWEALEYAIHRNNSIFIIAMYQNRKASKYIDEIILP